MRFLLALARDAPRSPRVAATVLSTFGQQAAAFAATRARQVRERLALAVVPFVVDVLVLPVPSEQVATKKRAVRSRQDAASAIGLIRPSSSFLAALSLGPTG